MEEKIGMEKLIELLNEYDGKNHWWDYDEEYLTSEEFYEENGDLEIISKKFGFIKWLVENDKIDIKKLIVKGEMRSGRDFDNKKGDEETGEEIWNKYYSELCLMLLSISDTPIEDLLLYLK